jgi:murein L,D-transpeptidase YafK
MPLTLLVGTAALTLVGYADSTRAVAKPASARTPAASISGAPSADSAEKVVVFDARLPVDSILVEKSAHRLSLYQRGRAVRTYLVALGQQPVGDKVRRGDMRTPEGRFTIEARNPGSRYHRALRISYPDAAHRARAHALGVSPGGDIMIHGLPPRQAWVGPAHRDFDWTEGCIAVTNAEIEEIWSAVPIGTPIHITP